METRIFLTDLAAYNNGYLIGRWVDLPLSDEDLAIVKSEILCEGEAICKDGEHEELFITDSDGFDDFYRVGEYDNIDDLNSMAEFLSGLDDSDAIKCEILLDNGYSFKDVLGNGLDYYDVDIYDFSNEYDPWDALVEQFIDDGLYGDIPENIRFYLDTEKMAKDLSYDYSEYKGFIYRLG